MRTPQRHLDEVMTQLIAAFPRSTPEVQQVTVQLYRLLAAGQPVSGQHIATTLQMPIGTVNEALQQIGSRVRYDEAAQIVAFGGLSLQPTAHRFVVNGQVLYTWCAWDSLFLPAILKQSARVESTCPVTGTAIQLVVTPEGITYCNPTSTVLSFVSPQTDACRQDIVANFCGYVWFFRSAEAGATWTAEHEGTFLLSLKEAYELGQRKNAAQFNTL
jgi:alkylmercury lyase